MYYTYYKLNGDKCWDELARILLGSERYMPELLSVQDQETSKYAIVPAGVSIRVPSAAVLKSDGNIFKAPWDVDEA